MTTPNGLVVAGSTYNLINKPAMGGNFRSSSYYGNAITDQFTLNASGYYDPDPTVPGMDHFLNYTFLQIFPDNSFLVLVPKQSNPVATVTFPP